MPYKECKELLLKLIESAMISKEEKRYLINMIKTLEDGFSMEKLKGYQEKNFKYEKVKRLLERIEANKFTELTKDKTDFEKGYTRGWNNALEKSIFLVNLYMKEGEKDE